ncbi:MAG: hypothetical protein JSS56_05780 [Proteobacteria bacterium]|nr:hypothetical protein [Pseudomonadota bacterium]
MNEAEKIAVEVQLRETRRRLSEVSAFYGALALNGPTREELREAMSGYFRATTRIIELLAHAIRVGREPSARDDAEIERNHRMRLAAMAALSGIAHRAAVTH